MRARVQKVDVLGWKKSKGKTVESGHNNDQEKNRKIK